jgi:DNA-binding MarR family transcriptional regulator
LALRLFRGLGTLELPVVRRHGLSLWGYEVLTRLADHPAGSQLELAAELDLDKSKIVRVVDELEASGYAARLTGRADRRLRGVEITQRGQEVVAATAADLRDVEEALLGQLPHTDAAATRDGLRALVAVVDGLPRSAPPHGR